ncbi:efflux RND transporter periplasmic adaptor subunit [Aurantiacibacter luteus]|uniref:efflux RND transporter periplasmic adaptor subunit n=1 Tax=Aurantiacibacter luteus TaxID=1581420 RepID=UPI0009E63BD4
MFDTPFDAYEDQAGVTRDGWVQHDDGIEWVEAPRAPAESEVVADERKSRRGWFVAALLAAIAVAAWWMSGGSPAPAAPPVATVTVAQPLERQITEWDEFVGRFSATNTVEVRPQVSGQIVRVHFTDGQYVRRGAPLFTIDARTFRAALAEAQAQEAGASSALALSQANLARAERLVAEDAVAATEIDRLRAEVRAGQAALQAARAAVASRTIDVGFTTVRAPISGRISDRRIDAGNLVSGGGAAATLLTTINAVDPVYFEFTGSEALYLKAQREGFSRGTAVEIRLADEPDYRWHGTLDFTDNGLDAASGTIRARAVVANEGGLLAPGLFGRMRLATGGTRAALLVPDTAIVTDQTRKQVLVVGDDGTVAARTVELGPQVNGLRVIESGLRVSDRVIITGLQMAVPGQQVRAEAGRITPGAVRPDDAASPAKPVSRAASATLTN